MEKVSGGVTLSHFCVINIVGEGQNKAQPEWITDAHGQQDRIGR